MNISEKTKIFDAVSRGAVDYNKRLLDTVSHGFGGNPETSKYKTRQFLPMHSTPLRCWMCPPCGYHPRAPLLDEVLA